MAGELGPARHARRRAGIQHALLHEGKEVAVETAILVAHEVTHVPGVGLGNPPGECILALRQVGFPLVRPEALARGGEELLPLALGLEVCLYIGVGVHPLLVVNELVLDDEHGSENLLLRSHLLDHHGVHDQSREPLRIARGRTRHDHVARVVGELANEASAHLEVDEEFSRLDVLAEQASPFVRVLVDEEAESLSNLLTPVGHDLDRREVAREVRRVPDLRKRVGLVDDAPRFPQSGLLDLLRAVRGNLRVPLLGGDPVQVLPVLTPAQQAGNKGTEQCDQNRAFMVRDKVEQIGLRVHFFSRKRFKTDHNLYHKNGLLSINICDKKAIFC